MYNFSCALNESYAAQVTVVGGGPAGVCAGHCGRAQRRQNPAD